MGQPYARVVKLRMPAVTRSLARTVLVAGLVSLSTGLAATAAEDGPVTVATKVFDRMVTYQLPEGFMPAFENTQGGHYIHENVPEGETVDSWSEMITLTGEEGLAAGDERTPEWLAENFRVNYAKNCPDTFSASKVDQTTINGYTAFAAYFGCGTVVSAPEPRSEAATIVFIKAGDTFYTLQWAERGAASDEAPEMDVEEWKARVAQLFPVSVCPSSDGESC